MNVYDSSRMSAVLNSLGYQPVDSYKAADLIIVNTCTIRDKARQKAVSFLGRLTRLKRHKPELVIAVAGCVAQHEGRALIDHFPHIDIVMGTQAVDRLPDLLRRVAAESAPVVDTVLTATIVEEPALLPKGSRTSGISDFVTIMRGCENYCTYCVVPYVRGREISRRPEHIVAEVRDLAAAGVREVTLLGQNVNSYGNKDGLCSFPRLLAMVNDVAGIERIRFTTSHPKDLSDELIEAFAGLEKLCHHFHLPVQSGSSRILKRMNRKYTRQAYMERLLKLRQTAGDMAVTTDIIVGFPGETEADFQETMDLLREADFDAIFGFMYSDRPLAPAAKFSDKVPEEEKKRRLNELLARQKEISQKKNSALVGQVVSVLVEGPSRRPSAGTGLIQPGAIQWMGRSATNKVVNFTFPDGARKDRSMKAGDLVRVRIDGGFAHSLSGRLVIDDNDVKHKGGRFYAA